MKSVNRTIPARTSAIVLAAASIVGCAHRQNSVPVVSVDPVVPDEAMQRRDWPQSTLIYPNGAVAAGPTQFNYEPKRDLPSWQYAFADSGTFFVNMALLPYNLIKHPQMGTVVSPGETVGPTYTANPVLPPMAIVEPSTPPVIENPGMAPSTPPVVEPGAGDSNGSATPGGPTTSDMVTPGTAETPAAAPPIAPSPAPMPAPEMQTPPTQTPPTQTPEMQTPPMQTPAQSAPTQTAPPQPAPMPTEAAPPPIQITPAAPPAPAAAPMPMAPAPTPPTPVSAPGEVAPSTPPVVEPPPPQATRNLAPPIQRSPSTQPYLNK